MQAPGSSRWVDALVGSGQSCCRPCVLATLRLPLRCLCGYLQLLGRHCSARFAVQLQCRSAFQHPQLSS